MVKCCRSHYGVKPIIYTGERYYDDFLKEEFSDYLFLPIIILQRRNSRRLVVLAPKRLPFLELKAMSMSIYNGDLQQLRFITVE
jgi:lysozyme